MNIKCIAIDDEPLAIEKIKLFIGRIPHLQLLAAFNAPEEAIQFIEKNQVQLAFLDIQMGKMSGIELLKKLEIRPQIIFTTAFSEYAIKAFELSVLDYLLKPYNFERFTKAVNKATDYIMWQSTEVKQVSPDVEYIFVKSGYKLVKILLDEIVYIQGMKDFQHIITLNSKILASLSFQELEKILPKGFVRCHKSYIVALSKIECIEKDRIKIGDQLIPIGDTYKELFYRQIK